MLNLTKEEHAKLIAQKRRLQRVISGFHELPENLRALVIRAVEKLPSPEDDPTNPYRRREPFLQNTSLTIEVPSGSVVVNDDLRHVPHFDVKSPSSINYGAGMDDWARLYARSRSVAYAFVGNTCPRMVRRPDGSLIIVSLDYDEDTEDPILELGEEIVASITTDLWAVMLVDAQLWTTHGGTLPGTSDNGPALVDVTPGTYQWTVFSHHDHFDMDVDGRIVYAELTLIDPTTEP